MRLSSLLAPLGLALTLMLSGCQTAENSLGGAHASPATSSVAATGHTLPELSVYHLEGRWQDQDGQEVSLASFRGKPQVLAVIYARCKGACPRIIREIQSMEDLLRTAHPQGVGYLLVTMDPEVDTPERLKALAQEYGLGPDWRLLRGSQDQVRELAAVLGVKFRKVSETDFAHSNTITILDAEGVVAYQKQELGTGVQGSAQAVTDLLAEPSPCCAETP